MGCYLYFNRYENRGVNIILKLSSICAELGKMRAVDQVGDREWYWSIHPLSDIYLVGVLKA